MLQYQDFRPDELKPHTSVSATIERFTADNPCPICGGYERLPHGRGERCYGYLSSDGQYAHCTREEYAGNLQPHKGGETYAHRLYGTCACDNIHGTFSPLTYYYNVTCLLRLANDLEAGVQPLSLAVGSPLV
jgi:hypothetical protein